MASPVEGIRPRTRIAMQSNAVLPRQNISPLACIADKRKGIRKGPPVTTELRVPCSGPDTAVNGCSQQRRLAQTSASPQATEQFANLARTWIRLADLRQVLSKRGSGRSTTHRRGRPRSAAAGSGHKCPSPHQPQPRRHKPRCRRSGASSSILLTALQEFETRLWHAARRRNQPDLRVPRS